jgi:hypothetical protein
VATLMFFDGVLRNPTTNAPIPAGMHLYRTFKEKGRVLVLADNRDRTDRWLRENKLALFDDIVGPEMTVGHDFPEYRQVEHCRGLGSIEYVVTSNPELSAKLLEVGITSLLFLQPVYIAEKFRPDSRQGAKSWTAIREEIVKQQEAFFEDERVK